MHTARWYTRPNAAMLTRSRLTDASSSGTARYWAWTAIDSVRRSTNPVSIYLRLQATSLTFLPRPLRRWKRPSKEVRDERSLFSFTAGALCLGLFSLMRGGIVTSLAAIPAQPWWSLLGGLLGASALLSYVVLAPKIGLSVLLGLAIAGQITSSLVIDHFGLMGTVERPVSPVKLGGSMVMLAGLCIALFGDRWSAFFSS